MAVKEAEDDARVSKLITQYYDNQPSGKSVIPWFTFPMNQVIFWKLL
jgi:hypothetical protein